MSSNLLNLIESGKVAELRKEVHKQKSNSNDPFKLFENGDSLFHRTAESISINEEQKEKIIYILADLNLDINLQNRNQQTCLHLAVISKLPRVVNVLLRNGADLTLTDSNNLCAYNYAKRIKEKEISSKILADMQSFYPTYLIGIEKNDMNVIRRLINSWCRFKINRNGKCLIEHAREKYPRAYELFKQLEAQMDLNLAVLALNTRKIEKLISQHDKDLKMGFKNLKENGAPILYYAIKENDARLLKVLCKKCDNVLNFFMSDSQGIDYPVYFAAVDFKISIECFRTLTPRITKSDSKLKQNDISSIFYRGKSFLRYSIEKDIDQRIIKEFMSSDYCSKELITQKDPDYLTAKQYAIRENKLDYCKLIDEISIDYILHHESFRKQMALNGFDFFDESLRINNKSILEYAKDTENQDLIDFLDQVKSYQNAIKDLHLAVEKNDYYGAKALFKLDSDEKSKRLFINDLLLSKLKNESQSLIHKCTLNENTEILDLVLRSLLDDEVAVKVDSIRDHCYRTPLHYANGLNKKLSKLLYQSGFSENVFDKDGMTPLDFQERIESEELQQLIKMHKTKNFNDSVEPNPWTWQVWTRLQRDKDNTKQLMLSNDPTRTFCSHHHHHQQHQHTHSHSHLQHEEDKNQEPSQNSSQTSYSQCFII